MGVLSARFFALVFLIASPTYACAHVEINVDLSSQTMTVQSGLGDTYVWPISSGKAGHATPNGVFRPRAMHAMVHSAKYNNAPMPHSIFFYGQYAIHGTNAVGDLRKAGVARLRPHLAGQRGDVVRHGAKAGGGNPHRRISVQRYRP